MPRAKAAPDVPAPPAVAPGFDFEQAMAELEAVVERLEQGDVPLEEALQAFERGVALTHSCQQALSTAEQKVEILLARPDGSREPAPFLDSTAADDAE